MLRLVWDNISFSAWPLTLLPRYLKHTPTFSVPSPSKQRLAATMPFWNLIQNIFGVQTATRRQQWQPPTPQRQPAADSSILNKFFDLNICIKQHVESFYGHEDPSILRQQIGKEIFNCVARGFDDKQMSFILKWSTEDARSNQHINVVWETGRSLRDLLQPQNQIWKWGKWDDPDGYIVVFPSIWKAELMVREWEIVKRR